MIILKYNKKHKRESTCVIFQKFQTNNLTNEVFIFLKFLINKIIKKQAFANLACFDCFINYLF